jgi:hypothetical protein
VVVFSLNMFVCIVNTENAQEINFSVKIRGKILNEFAHSYYTGKSYEGNRFVFTSLLIC